MCGRWDGLIQTHLRCIGAFYLVFVKSSHGSLMSNWGAVQRGNWEAKPNLGGHLVTYIHNPQMQCHVLRYADFLVPFKDVTTFCITIKWQLLQTKLAGRQSRQWPSHWLVDQETSHWRTNDQYSKRSSMMVNWLRWWIEMVAMILIIYRILYRVSSFNISYP